MTIVAPVVFEFHNSIERLIIARITDPPPEFHAAYYNALEQEADRMIRRLKARYPTVEFTISAVTT